MAIKHRHLKGKSSKAGSRSLNKKVLPMPLQERKFAGIHNLYARGDATNHKHGLRKRRQNTAQVVPFVMILQVYM
jgi:hypothetical protein